MRQSNSSRAKLLAFAVACGGAFALIWSAVAATPDATSDTIADRVLGQADFYHIGEGTIGCGLDVDLSPSWSIVCEGRTV